MKESWGVWDGRTQTLFEFLFILACFILFCYSLLSYLIIPSIILWLVITLEVPSLIITAVGSLVSIKEEECRGLRAGGRIIGYAERALIFLIFMITYYTPQKDYSSILSFLALIVAGKGLFRFGSTDNRACAEWYILGTFMSILLGTALSWVFFRLILGE